MTTTRSRIAAPVALLTILLVGCTTASSRKPLKGLAEYKADWERDWSSDWILIEAREEQIDHFKNGYVLMWERRGDPTTVRRREVFDHSWRLRSAHEFIQAADRTVAWGNLLIATDGQPLMCAWTFLSTEVKWNVIVQEEVPQADHWELQLLEPAVADCRYRSDTSNFAAFQVGPMRGLRSVPDDARLMDGTECPSIAELRDNPFEPRLSGQ